MSKKTDYIGIYGPTASGKTALSLKLAADCDIEIISVDSALVYKAMDIGTAKPTQAERSICPHHLIDVITPDQSFSVGQFNQKATKLIHEINARGNMPVLVGGTALYFQSLALGYSNLPTINAKTSENVTRTMAQEGREQVHQHLCIIDIRHKKLSPNDTQRLMRAACVFEQTGQSIFDFWNAQKSELHGQLFSITPPSREQLKKHIHERLTLMLDSGFIEETQSVINQYQLTPDHNSMRCVGYRQIFDMLNGKIHKTELRDRIYFATCQYAKRQITWLNKLKTEHLSDISYIELRDTIQRKIL